VSSLNEYRVTLYVKKARAPVAAASRSVPIATSADHPDQSQPRHAVSELSTACELRDFTGWCAPVARQWPPETSGFQRITADMTNGPKNDGNPLQERVSVCLSQAGDETRTHDPQLGKLMLYQLSYTRVDHSF
jgi:hypothetical protein